MDDFPKYSYADELKGPSELGIRRDGSFGSVLNAIGGINYYMDSIGFGSATAFAKHRGGALADQRPLGLRFFTKTGHTCSNGAPMYEYISTIPTGNLMGKRITNELQNMGFPRLQGLAPGILEDAVSATNPIPFVKAAQGAYPKCKKVRERVGSNEPPYIRSRVDPNAVWIKDTDLEFDGNGVPYLKRWVLDRWVSQKEWDCTPKTEAPKVEGFESQHSENQKMAMLLLGVLGLAVLSYAASKSS